MMARAFKNVRQALAHLDPAGVRQAQADVTGQAERQDHDLPPTVLKRRRKDDCQGIQQHGRGGDAAPVV
jgi:hypothetical protein